MTIWLLRNQVLLIFASLFFLLNRVGFRLYEPFSLSGGGLKWTFCNWLLRNQTGSRHLRRISFEIWWAQMDSDHRPHAYQACALTSWAMSPYVVEVFGFEPMTPCLQGRCSTSWAIPPFTSRFSQNKCLPCLREATLLKTNKKETIRSFPISTRNG